MAAAAIINDIIDCPQCPAGNHSGGSSNSNFSSSSVNRSVHSSRLEVNGSAGDKAIQPSSLGGTLPLSKKDGLKPNKWKARQLADILEQYSQMQAGHLEGHEHGQQHQQAQRAVQAAAWSHSSAVAHGEHAIAASSPTSPQPVCSASNTTTHQTAVKIGLGFEGEGI